MSYFLITHPRSGSSNLGTNFCKLIANTEKIWNLDEMFHPGCRHLWGDYRQYSAGKSSTLLEINLLADIFNIQNVEKVEIISNMLFKKINQTTLNSNQWLEKELENRLAFLKKLDDHKQKYFIKLFIDDDRWFRFDFLNSQRMILYRRNFLEAVSSILIKNFYQTNLFLHKGFRENYKGNYITVPDFSFRVENDYLYYRILPFLNLLKFVKNNPHIERVVYEDLFIANRHETTVIFDQNIILQDIEEKLKYSKDKLSYIKNLTEVLEWITSYIEKENLHDICQELSIYYGQ